MYSPILYSTFFFLLFAVLLVDFSGVSASVHHVSRVNHNRMHRRRLESRLESRTLSSENSAKPLRKRKSCSKRHPPSPVTPSNPTASAKRDDSQKPTTTKESKPGSTNDGGISVNVGAGVAFKPANWPTKTQPAATPAARRTSPSDPYLTVLSQSYNNKDNSLYTEVHKGEMTYYGQGLGACGDTYDDNSMTAAVSQLLFDAWPGAWAGEMNRNPICGPFVTGRKLLNMQGKYDTVVPGKEYVIIGGDGYLNCDTGIIGHSQCHIPLTATVKHGSKSIIVKIVDRCEGCAKHDIDLTPAAFKALADPALGRTDVEWFFNQY